MEKTTQQTNKKTGGVSFDNLKELSQISNVTLSKMSKDLKKVIMQVDGFAKNLRDVLREKSSIAKESVMPMLAAEPVPQEVNVSPVENTATTVTQPGKNEVRKFNNQNERPARNDSQRAGGSFNSSNQSREGGFKNQGTRTDNRPQFNRTGGDNRPPFNRNASGNDRPQFNRTGGDNRPPFNRNAGGDNRPPFNRNAAGSGNSGFPFSQRNSTSAARPGVGGTLKADKPTERFPVTQKKVFDNNVGKRKDYDKFNKDGDRFNKRNARKGLAEEQSIEERIMGSRKIKVKKAKDIPVVQAQIEKAIITSEAITVKQLSEKIGKPVSEILKKLMILGIMSNINSSIDFATCELVASELGVELELKLEKSYEEKLADEFVTKAKSQAGNLQKRPPIVTVMGHVDHGKTSLLDYIRKTNVTSQESGGITQHIGAYQIEKKGNKITFIDTPGHAAFSAMRARGASVTDIAILVVAADDGIKPQTKEAIKHIKEANVPMIVAVNKMDKPEANFDRVKTQLTEEGIIPEEWGGDTIIVPISALKGDGVDKLLDMVLLVTDMQELTADPKAKALGMVIEAKLDKGKGPMARVIILNGTLRVGDTIISGLAVGKVRAMIDENGKNVKVAPPSIPVSVLGLDQVPSAGDQLYAADDAMSKKVLQERIRKIQTDKLAPKSTFSIDDFLAKSTDSEKKVLNIVVKADVQGSFEALTEMLNQVQNEEVKVECIHGGVGAISESDITMAQSANAIIIGFNSKPDANAAGLAEKNKIKVHYYKIIYQAIDEVNKIIKSMRTPIFEEKIIGHANVVRIFKISRIGTVAGCVVTDGKITKNSKIRLYRGDELLADTKIITLQRERDDVKEVLSGFDMGIKLDGHNDILLDDRLEAYIMQEVIRD